MRRTRGESSCCCGHVSRLTDTRRGRARHYMCIRAASTGPGGRTAGLHPQTTSQGSPQAPSWVCTGFLSRSKAQASAPGRGEGETQREPLYFPGDGRSDRGSPPQRVGREACAGGGRGGMGRTAGGHWGPGRMPKQASWIPELLGSCLGCEKVLCFNSKVCRDPCPALSPSLSRLRPQMAEKHGINSQLPRPFCPQRAAQGRGGRGPRSQPPDQNRPLLRKGTPQSTHRAARPLRPGTAEIGRAHV